MQIASAAFRAKGFQRGIMNGPTPKDSQVSLSQFTLFDIALAVAEHEAAQWGDEAGLNLFLDETLYLVRREAESMAALCSARTGERARVFVLCGAWSLAQADKEHLEDLARSADVWVFGASDCHLSLAGVVGVAVPPDAPLARERGVIIEAPSFGAAFFAHEAGLLDPSNVSSRYYEGFLTASQEAVEIAAGRLTSFLKLAPLVRRWVDHELANSWFARLNRRILEELEAQRLKTRAQEDELERNALELLHQREESEKLEKMIKGYVGGQTWAEVQNAMLANQEDIADREREEYTICFCDLVGFTKLSERLSPPEIASLLNEHFARLYNIVRFHGGTIDKFIGDAMLAYFPHPVEAFEAGKKMVQESRTVTISSSMNSVWSVPIQVRVGLNTGTVALANLGVSEIRQRTVLGEAVNFAQRMQSAAPPHSMMISEATLRKLPPVLIRALEPMRVVIKGRTTPVEAYVWTTSTERREEVNERLSLRSTLLSTSQRSAVADRLRGTQS